jgi:gas vesicle protein
MINKLKLLTIKFNKNIMKSGNSFLTGLLTGAAIGGALALLYAPKSGKETREQIKRKFEELENELENLKGKASQKTGKAKDDLAQKLADLQKDIEDLSKAI